MNRSRLIGGLLTVILLVCVGVIVLDQMGLFSASQPTTQTTTQDTTPPGNTSTGDGYGGLK